MLTRFYIVMLRQFVYYCLAALPASTAQTFAQATASLLPIAHNDTLPLPPLGSMTAILFPSSYVVRDADPRVVFQIISFPSPDRLSGIFFTGVVLQGMDEIVHGMRDHGGDGPIPTIGYILHAEDVAIDVYPNESRGGLFTFSVAETVLRGTWELMAAYGFYSVHMEIFLGPQAMADYIGQITVQRTESNSTVATAVPAATDT